MNDCLAKRARPYVTGDTGAKSIRCFIAAIASLVALAGYAGGQSAQASSSTARVSRVSSATVACSQVGTKKFAKTRFLLHAGLGLGAFKKFVYDPFKAGKFKSGASGSASSLGAPIILAPPSP